MSGLCSFAGTAGKYLFVDYYSAADTCPQSYHYGTVRARCTASEDFSERGTVSIVSEENGKINIFLKLVA